MIKVAPKKTCLKIINIDFKNKNQVLFYQILHFDPVLICDISRLFHCFAHTKNTIILNKIS